MHLKITAFVRSVKKMRAWFLVIILFSFLACTSTRKTGIDDLDCSLIMLDTTMHVDIDPSFDKLPLSSDSVFSDTNIYKYSTTDTINSKLKEKLFKLGMINFFSNKIDTLPDWQLFFHTLKIYKLARMNLYENISSYLLLDKIGDFNQKILLLNVDSDGRLVSIYVLASRFGLNGRIMTTFSGRTKVKTTIHSYDPSDCVNYFLFKSQRHYKEDVFIDMEINSAGKWKVINYEIKK